MVPHVSFEFFPPKNDAAIRELERTTAKLSALSPNFVSVTYGAGGSTREPTRRTVELLQCQFDLEVAPHLTCVDSTVEETLEIAQQYADTGISKLVALRGDPRDGLDGGYTPPQDGFAYASDLIATLNSAFDFDLYASAYPESHPTSPSLKRDIEILKLKQDSGATSAITQFFFKNDDFLRYRDLAAAAGITLPIVPGIMIPENIKGVARFAQACGASVPAHLLGLFSGIEEDEETRRSIAIHFSIQQCEALVREGVNDLHFYTLNKAESTFAVCHALGVRETLDRVA